MNSTKPLFLLVDDNEIDIIVNTKLVKVSELASDIISFPSCDKFMDFLNLRIANDQLEPIVVLLDIQMPRTNGFQCIGKYAELDEKYRNFVKIFMLSSSIDRGDIEQAEANPFVIKVMEKPLDTDLLSTFI